MAAQEDKLVHLGASAETAAALVAAGLGLPADIANASEETLETVLGEEWASLIDSRISRSREDQE